jgi:hypothetical protein
MSAKEERKVDSYGFPIQSQNTAPSSGFDFNKMMKIIFWILLVMFIFFNIMTGSLAAYLSYFEFQNDPTLSRVLKMSLAIFLNWFYLGWKGLQFYGLA